MTAIARLHPRHLLIAAVVVLVASFVVAPHAQADPEIHRVGPADDVQATIDTANPGDLILLSPGIYAGGWEIGEDKTGLEIRGLDRNAVVLDGEYEREIAITAYADDVTMRNMTARHFTRNGFYWRSVTGFHGAYLTTYRVGMYGIYAFDSAGESPENPAVFEHSYASGSADASFYIGQCRPCNAVIRNVVAEHSALGYSGTNAGGELILEDSVWQLNAAGIVPNSLDSQEDPPQRGGSIIRNNVISHNGNPDVPAAGIAGAIIGHGVAIAGGEDNVIEDNAIRGNAKYGVVLHPIPGGSNLYPPANNTIRDNEARYNGLADFAVSAGSGTGNCFVDNNFITSAPEAIEDTYPCEGTGLNAVPVVGDPGVAAVLVADFAEASTGLMDRPSYTEMPDAPPQPSMPDPDPEA